MMRRTRAEVRGGEYVAWEEDLGPGRPRASWNASWSASSDDGTESRRRVRRHIATRPVIADEPPRLPTSAHRADILDEILPPTQWSGRAA